jgi:hypothetical protein
MEDMGMCVRDSWSEATTLLSGSRSLRSPKLETLTDISSSKPRMALSGSVSKGNLDNCKLRRSNNLKDLQK